jgi:hypothetical protein
VAGDIFGELLINGVDRNNLTRAGEDLDGTDFLVLKKEFGVVVVAPTILRGLEVVPPI